MRIKFEFDASIAGIMDDEIRLAERAITRGIREVGDSVQKTWRGKVVSTLGSRLANAIRKKNYPENGESIGAASLVYAQPNRKKSASAADVIDAFDKGVLIKRSDINGDPGVYLAIPTPAAGRVRGSGRLGRLTPDLWEKRTGAKLRFVYRRTGPSWLVLDNSRINSRDAAVPDRRRRRKNLKTVNRSDVIFYLVRQSKLPKLFDLDREARSALNRLPSTVLKHWK